uniref:Uncharacterized protein LOC105035731 n=2 Tax=Elaeis guineensis var. tenera TaxID=51953 RepID=A0A6J0PDB6_ELAGV|nr:uncharacterized protein LOC105035731 [Elaeis guineensis]XP_019702977.1 uncharacterized protein LOC105035731 [Elaeis guineensis]
MLGASAVTAKNMELEEVDLLDPTPDIHALFCHYNPLYFEDALGACVVKWSSPRMTRCAGTCHYQKGGGCVIHLSEPLLKFRSISDLKNTLLHEMIHAFLWITKKNRDHSDHGPSFQAIMNSINSSSLTDHQRPSGGYKITIYHDFHEEVDSYRVHQWICESCGDLIKRSMNRQPSASDCLEHAGHSEFCGNASCHWHRHMMLCGGSYVKIAEPPGFKDKRRVSKGAQGLQADRSSKGSSHVTRECTRRLQKNTNVKGSSKITNFFSFAHDGNRNFGSSSPSDNSFRRDIKSTELAAIKLDTWIHAMAPEIPKQARTPACRKKRKFPLKQRDDIRAHLIPENQKKQEFTSKRKRIDKLKNEFTVISKWLDYYADEETDEDIEPLVNKRSERRKKQKLLKHQMAREPDKKTAEIAFLPYIGNCSKGGDRYWPSPQHKNGGQWRPTAIAKSEMEAYEIPVGAGAGQQSASFQACVESGNNTSVSGDYRSTKNHNLSMDELPLSSPVRENIIDIIDISDG